MWREVVEWLCELETLTGESFICPSMNQPTIIQSSVTVMRETKKKHRLSHNLYTRPHHSQKIHQSAKASDKIINYALDLDFQSLLRSSRSSPLPDSKSLAERGEVTQLPSLDVVHRRWEAKCSLENSINDISARIVTM